MSAYLALRRWVDEQMFGPQGSRDLVTVAFRLPFLLGVSPFLMTPVLGRWWLVPAFVLAAIWESFVAWRLWRGLRAGGTRGDREYDRKGKFKLSREYWTSESATAARRRKK